ncbi:MAG: tripartite tricarboxylate transporter TctB family protein [Actinomycetota bacterium]|nr:tripartite tricarboxylate transporter TctB family protein [Actinomycetota bacterium]
MSTAPPEPSAPRHGNTTDLTLGALLLVFGIGVILAAAQLKAGSTTDPLGPRGFPGLLGLGFLGAGVGLLVKTTLAGRRPADDVVSVMDLAGADEEEDDGPANRFRLVVAALAVIAYVLLLPYGGFLLTTSAFLAALIRLQGGVGLRPFIAMVLGFPTAVFLLFAVILGVPLPSGVFDPLLLTDWR